MDTYKYFYKKSMKLNIVESLATTFKEAHSLATLDSFKIDVKFHLQNLIFQKKKTLFLPDWSFFFYNRSATPLRSISLRIQVSKDM